MSRIHRAVVLVGFSLLLVGCKGGGGAIGLVGGDSSSFSSFFDGSGSSGSGDGLDQLASLDLDNLGDGEGDQSGDGDQGGPGGQGGDGLGGGSDGDGGNGGSEDFESVGTVHQPEPASLALFAGGLGLAMARRRTRKVM